MKDRTKNFIIIVVSLIVAFFVMQIALWLTGLAFRLAILLWIATCVAIVILLTRFFYKHTSKKD